MNRLFISLTEQNERNVLGIISIHWHGQMEFFFCLAAVFCFRLN